MTGALEILRPLLADTGAEKIGTFLMGTVKGDVHDIGKNLVDIMLEGAGFKVVDLGVQIAPETFVDAIKEHKPDVVGFSAFLTTTMPMFKVNIEAIEKAGLRDDVIIMVGGAPVTQEYADAVGADGYAADAATATRRAKELLAERRSPGAGLSGMHTVLRSPSREVVIGPDQPFCIIGERINPTGRKAFGEQLRNGDLSQVVVDVEEQVAGGRARPRREHGRPADRRGGAARQRRAARPGAHRPAALHRLVRGRGARGRARRVRGEGARQLGHLRGGPARARAAARQGARRGDHLPRQRRDRDPGHGAGPAGGVQAARRRRPRPLRDPARGHGHRPARDDRRRRSAGGGDDAGDDSPDSRRVRAEHDARRVERLVRAAEPPRPRRRLSRRGVLRRPDERDHGRPQRPDRGRLPRGGSALRARRVGDELDRGSPAGGGCTRRDAPGGPHGDADAGRGARPRHPALRALGHVGARAARA